jgi:DHA1 family inner membrane transport protein
MTDRHPVAPSTAEPGSTNWRAVAMVVASGVIVALQVGKGIITLPALRSDFALGLEAAGWVISIFAFLGVFGGIPAGVAVNRFGDKFLCMAGLPIWHWAA